MKTLLHYLFITLLIFSSCSKDDTGKIVTAGIYDSDFTFHEFSSPLKVMLILDPLTDNYIGNDSIDINLDGVYDLVISQRIHFPSPSGIPSWEQFPYYRLILKNGLEVATKTECFPAGMGQYRKIDWVNVFDYESSIDKISEWSESNTTQTMWAIPPITQAVSYGPWYDLTNAVKYIAIRIKIGNRYKLGWIKVSEISRENILFISYAIEK